MSDLAATLEQAVHIPPVGLSGDLTIPRGATGIVLFAHGSGSSRYSPRNRYVAEHLNRAGLATLLFDLLTMQEERIDAQTYQLRFDIVLLAQRLLQAMDWIRQGTDTRHLRAGYFGASTGGGAALMAAAQRPEDVSAIVSRGGRPDLAGEWLRRVHAPTLLVVGGLDDVVLEVNRSALREIPAEEKRLDVITGATHLFEEPGAIEQVADAAREWFGRFLA